MKKILFITATHGHEGFSIPVFEEIERRYSRQKYGYSWIIGNPKALQEGVRFLDTDLNRSAPGSKDGISYEIRRAAELIEVAQDYEYVLDIHGTRSISGIFTIVSYPTLRNLILATALPIKNVVIWNAQQSRIQGPLTQYMCRPSVGIECGPKLERQTQKKLFEVVENIILNLRENAFSDLIRLSQKKSFYEVYGKLSGNMQFDDFKKYQVGQEKFFALLGKNEYKNQNIGCYKMKRINFEDLFLYEKN